MPQLRSPSSPSRHKNPFTLLGQRELAFAFTPLVEVVEGEDEAVARLAACMSLEAVLDLIPVFASEANLNVVALVAAEIVQRDGSLDHRRELGRLMASGKYLRLTEDMKRVGITTEGEAGPTMAPPPALPQARSILG